MVDGEGRDVYILGKTWRMLCKGSYYGIGVNLIWSWVHTLRGVRGLWQMHVRESDKSNYFTKNATPDICLLWSGLYVLGWYCNFSGVSSETLCKLEVKRDCQGTQCLEGQRGNPTEVLHAAGLFFEKLFYSFILAPHHHYTKVSNKLFFTTYQYFPESSTYTM